MRVKIVGSLPLNFNKMKTVKQCIGIDVSKDSLECCIGITDSEQHQTFGRSKKFSNTDEGFKELLKWTETENELESVFVMEAT